MKNGMNVNINVLCVDQIELHFCKFCSAPNNKIIFTFKIYMNQSLECISIFC